MNGGLLTAIVYLSAAALTVGAIRAGRAAVERQGRDITGLVLAAGGVAGLGASVVAFNLGAKTVLPF